MNALSEMPKHTLSLSPSFREEIKTERLSIRPLEQFCASLIWKAFKETNGFTADNGEFHYYAGSPVHQAAQNENTPQEGLRFVWSNLLKDMSYKKPEAMFLGLYAENEKALIGILAVWFDKRNWLRISPFVFQDYKRNHYAQEAYEGIGQRLGTTFGNALMYAVISKDNEGSLALFRSLGFEDVAPTKANVDVPHHRPDIMSLGQKQALCRNFSYS